MVIRQEGFLEIILQEEVVMTDWGSCTKYME